MTDIVFLVDDDPNVLRSLGLLLHSSGFRVLPSASAEAFEHVLAIEGLAEDRIPNDGIGRCLVLDINMPGTNGRELFDRLKQRHLIDMLPVIPLTGHGDVAMAVEMVQAGAHYFLEKPPNTDQLVDLIRKAHRKSVAAMETTRVLRAEMARWAKLSDRELEVVQLLMKGMSNQQVCDKLNIGMATIKTHRLSARRKLNVREFVELTPSPKVLELITKRSAQASNA
ncbi:response regulator transcription factor [Piscinibacter gummiphilus]|uniref:Response regulator n=1 Tax=Piscinibacter gummiphilus TaxID=946333 RepID=A0ABZ0D1Q7_9BURK|nr:response regulator [Piscinibacter gummiphilus]WOB11185.1 response regulator [Piscinibacter gummiphilus]